MKYALFTFCLFLLGYSSPLLAQEKIEMETRIRSKAVPKAALAFIQQLNSKKKQRWYKEISQLGTTVECKFKHNKQLHSIEFDEAGKLQDMEIPIPQENVPSDALKEITNTLDTKYDKWKFIKIQIQYSGGDKQVIETFKTPSDTKLSPKYEIVLKGKTNKETQSYEYLFDNNGILIKKLLIPSRNTDNLEY